MYESVSFGIFTINIHTETSKLMYNWSFLFVVLHKTTLLPSTFNRPVYSLENVPTVLGYKAHTKYSKSFIEIQA